MSFDMMRILFLFFLCYAPLFAEEEIVVHVSSADRLATLSLNPIQDRGAHLEKSYLNSLEKILHFDLSHNGRTDVVKAKCSGSLLDREKWRQSGVDYAVEVIAAKNALSIKALNVRTGSVKKLDGISLSGSLNEDRLKMHQVADAIHQAFFHEPGIATTRVLYTLRTRKSTTSTQWVSEVWECDYDGGNTKQITQDGHLCVTPIYLPSEKGKHCQNFLFVSYKIGQPKIYSSHTQHGSSKRLTYLKGNQLMPSISPKQDTIAFICDVSGNPDLFIQDFSLEKGVIGKPRQIFSAPSAAQGSPTFSPDGNQIAFVSNKDGSARIYTMSVPDKNTRDITGPRLISRQNRDNTSPAWSPDGKKLAYCSSTKGVRQIWVYDFEKGEETQLTDGPTHKENPAWAPNSLHLVFNSATATHAELYLINLNQKKAVKISSGAGEKRFPAWEPLKIDPT